MPDRRRHVRRNRPQDTRQAENEVMDVYRELEARPIERSCVSRTECCRFRLTGRTPMLTRGEALVAARGVRASGRSRLPAQADGSCPLLREDGRCSIYESRPFGCRTHFCAAAGGVWPRREIRDLIQRLEEIDEKTGGDGPRPLQAAVADALG